MMGLSTEVQLCGYYRLDCLIKYIGTTMIFFLGTSIYIITEHIYTRAADKKYVTGQLSAWAKPSVDVER